MKKSTLKTLIKNLPTNGNCSGLIRQLAGADAQKYRDATACLHYAGMGEAVDTARAKKALDERNAIVAAFVEKYGEMTVERFINLGERK